MGDSENSSNSNEIWVYDFDDESAQKFREQVMERAMHGPDEIIPIYIDSYGGYVDSLAKMIETMDEVENRFITICSGKAMSCGAVLFSHGDVRYIGSKSRIMIHNISKGSWGDCYSLKATSDEAIRLNRVFMGLLAENCDMDYKELQLRIRDATDSKEIWLAPAEAKKFGIADYVGTPIIRPAVYWQVEVAPKKISLREQEKKANATKSKKKPSKKKKTATKK